ncbi:hypothetical protein [Kineococcus aurantiacus]|uniref:family 4 glycosyl hydrolase n=1 Tax=Kineococcus aurantiacus TaxID=37633 RepID=UPI0031D79389
MPTGCVVEVPPAVGARGVEPVPRGSLPVQAAAVDRPHVSVAELTVEAARTGEPRLLRQAVLVDPDASSTLTPEQIRAVGNDLVVAHGDLLPEPLRETLPPNALRPDHDRGVPGARPPTASAGLEDRAAANPPSTDRRRTP